jgi:micrococcal nuclease
MTGRVVWVADGDTIHVRMGSRLEKVRYIGVNAPEIPHPDARGWREGGAQAHAANLQLVARQTAWLELDTGVRDPHGRLLAYVWVQRSGAQVMANAEMLREGFAQVMTIPPNVRYQALFLTLQREARKAGRGLWGQPQSAPRLL